MTEGAAEGGVCVCVYSGGFIHIYVFINVPVFTFVQVIIRTSKSKKSPRDVKHRNLAFVLSLDTKSYKLINNSGLFNIDCVRVGFSFKVRVNVDPLRVSTSMNIQTCLGSDDWKVLWCTTRTKCLLVS